MQKYLISGDLGVNGIYRAKLILDDSNEIRAFIPGLSTINPFNKDGSINEETYKLHKNSFPKVQWCCYNIESKDLANQDPLSWVMFENGDFRRPVVISYAVIGGSGETSGVSGGNSSGSSTSGSSSSSGSNSNAENGVLGNGTTLIVPDEYGTVCTYERLIINTKYRYTDSNGVERIYGWYYDSPQGELIEKAHNNGTLKQGNIFGLNNCAIINNRLMIATKPNIGGSFPVAIEDYLDVEFTDGTVWNCIVGDAKGSDASHPWGHNDGASVVEIIYWDYSTNSGNIYKKISKIVKVGSYK